MRVFVLTTGRAASATFAEACKLLEGFTAGHETRREIIQGRLEYPDNHIEVDNRLAWFLGSLDKLYEDNSAFYVHLTRNGHKVARSYLERWHISVSIVRAFYYGVLMFREKPDHETALRSIELFVSTVDDNIQFFLKSRSNWALVRVENLEEDFFRFMDAAGLDGDREAISRVLSMPANATKKRKHSRIVRKFQAFFSSRKIDIP